MVNSSPFFQRPWAFSLRTVNEGDGASLLAYDISGGFFSFPPFSPAFTGDNCLSFLRVFLFPLLFVRGDHRPFPFFFFLAKRLSLPLFPFSSSSRLPFLYFLFPLFSEDGASLFFSWSGEPLFPFSLLFLGQTWFPLSSPFSFLEPVPSRRRRR